MVGVGGVGKGLHDSSIQTEQLNMIGLTKEPFNTNDDGRTDRVKFRDAIASKNLHHPQMQVD